jgi:hypothetical protein
MTVETLREKRRLGLSTCLSGCFGGVEMTPNSTCSKISRQVFFLDPIGKKPLFVQLFPVDRIFAGVSKLSEEVAFRWPAKRGYTLLCSLTRQPLAP